MHCVTMAQHMQITQPNCSGTPLRCPEKPRRVYVQILDRARITFTSNSDPSTSDHSYIIQLTSLRHASYAKARLLAHTPLTRALPYRHARALPPVHSPLLTTLARLLAHVAFLCACAHPEHLFTPYLLKGLVL